MESILYEIKDHAIGLNCGMWDYSVSILANFGSRPEYILPSRQKYVNLEANFMRNYYANVIRTCHDHGAVATGGMAALLHTKTASANLAVINSKKLEVAWGVDGFLVYDLKFCDDLGLLLRNSRQLHRDQVRQPRGVGLLDMPKGEVRHEALAKNITVGVLFIQAWMNGHGTFLLENSIEDSATAEISRLQVWQWLKHDLVSKEQVKDIIDHLLETDDNVDLKSGQFFLELVQLSDQPQFITTWLNDHPIFTIFLQRF